MAFRMSSCMESSAMVLASPSASTSRSTWVSRSAISFWESSTPATPGTSVLVDQIVRGDRGGDEDGDDVDDLDHRVDGRPGRVLVGVADRVARDRGLVCLRRFASEVTFFDLLLGVVPGSPATRHLNRQ